MRRIPALLTALALLVIWLGIGGVGGPLVGRLSEVASNDNASFLPSSAEATKVNALTAQFNETDALPIFIVVQRDAGLTAAQQQEAVQWSKGLAGLKVPGTDTLIKDYLVTEAVPVSPSKDGQAIELILLADAEKSQETVGDDTAVQLVVEQIRDHADQLRDKGLTVAVGGPGGIIADLVNAFAGIDGRLLQVTLGVVFVILLLVYRSPVLPFVALLSAVFALALAGLVIYPLAGDGHIDLNGQSQGILSILAVGAATDYALLLISRYREELHRHTHARDALLVAWKASAPPILASGGTVALGLLCLLLSELGSNRGLGPVGAIGVVASMLSVLTFLPAMLLAGRWLFWPRMPRADLVGEQDSTTDEQGQALHGTWGKVANLVGRRARLVWTLTALLLVAFAAFLPTLATQGTTQVEAFRNREESVVAAELLEQHFAVAAGTPTVVVTGADNWQQAATVIRGRPHVAAVTPLTAAGNGAPSQASAPPMVKDGRVLLNVTLDVPADSVDAQDVVKDLRSQLDSVSDQSLVGGSAAVTLDTRIASERDLRVVIPAVLAVIFMVLVALLRSLVAPAMLLLANILSYATTLGVCALIFNHVMHMPGGDPVVPLFAFVFLIALGVDYSIFLLTRGREESLRLGTRPGVLLALTVTGGVITSAGVVLAATFAALATIPLLFMVQIAMLVAIGVLIDTFIVRSLLVPALAVELGPRLWAPRRLPSDQLPSDRLPSDQLPSDQAPSVKE